VRDIDGLSNRDLHQLLRVDIGDDPEAWTKAGFSVVDAETRIGSTVIRLRGTENGRGILSAGIDGITDSLDGLPVSPPIPRFNPRISPVHANLVASIDHLVATSPDMDRTTEVLTDAGLSLRRTRLFDASGATNRQAFFWLGDVILEVAGSDGTHGAGPANWWGMAFTCPDLDASCESLGPLLAEPRDAVQPGRRIAGLHTDDISISVPIVFMSAHPTPDQPGTA